jgi:hypothetical protein
MPEPDAHSVEVKSREDFVRFLQLLHTDSVANPTSWENKNLEAFLEAFARGYYKNSGSPKDADQPDWGTCAVIIRGASKYE